MANADISASGKAISVSSVRASGMLAKPFRQAKECIGRKMLAAFGSDYRHSTPHVKAVNRVSVKDIVAWRFTKRQSGYQGDYWVLSLSGNCWPSRSMSTRQGRRGRRPQSGGIMPYTIAL